MCIVKYADSREDCLYEPDSLGRTLLHIAAREGCFLPQSYDWKTDVFSGNVDLVKQLVKYGANADKRDSAGIIGTVTSPHLNMGLIRRCRRCREV